jgi:hypothetical protein
LADGKQVYETLLYLFTPFVLTISFYVRPTFCAYLLAGTLGLYYANAILFNEIHLRRKGERVGFVATYIYYMPYKLVLTAINVASCYWSLWKYARYFAKRHPKVIEDERAVEVVLRLEEQGLTPPNTATPGSRCPKARAREPVDSDQDYSQNRRASRRISVVAIGTRLSVASANHFGVDLGNGYAPTNTSPTNVSPTNMSRLELPYSNPFVDVPLDEETSSYHTATSIRTRYRPITGHSQSSRRFSWESASDEQDQDQTVLQEEIDVRHSAVMDEQRDETAQQQQQPRQNVAKRNRLRKKKAQRVNESQQSITTRSTGETQRGIENQEAKAVQQGRTVQRAVGETQQAEGERQRQSQQSRDAYWAREAQRARHSHLASAYFGQEAQRARHSHMARAENPFELAEDPTHWTGNFDPWAQTAPILAGSLASARESRSSVWEVTDAHGGDVSLQRYDGGGEDDLELRDFEYGGHGCLRLGLDRRHSFARSLV